MGNRYYTCPKCKQESTDYLGNCLNCGDQYTNDENHLVEWVEVMLSKYGVNLDDIIDILKDRINEESNKPTEGNKNAN